MLVGVLVGVLAACTSPGGDSLDDAIAREASDQSPATNEEAEAMEERRVSDGGDSVVGRWVLVSLDGDPAPTTVELDLTVTDDGQISGYAGCNRFMKGGDTAAASDIALFHPRELRALPPPL